MSQAINHENCSTASLLESTALNSKNQMTANFKLQSVSTGTNPTGGADVTEVKHIGPFLIHFAALAAFCFACSLLLLWAVGGQVSIVFTHSCV